MIARSIGAAPRQRGSSEGWTFSSGISESSGSRISCPKAQTTATSGRAARIRSSASGALTSPAWSSSIPSSRAASATGGAWTLLPRPWGRSGGVTTSGGRCGESARPRSTSAAKSDVPRKTTLTDRFWALGARLPRPPRRRPRPAGCSCRPPAAPAAPPCAARGWSRSRISTPSRWSISCWRTRASRPEASSTTGSPPVSRPPIRACRGRSTSIDTRGRLRQPSSATTASPESHFDLRVDQRRRLAVGAGLEDEHATQDPELGGGQPDPHAVAHDRDHPLDLGPQLGAELGDLRGPALQHRVAELDDLGERRFAPLQPLLPDRSRSPASAPIACSSLTRSIVSIARLRRGPTSSRHPGRMRHRWIGAVCGGARALTAGRRRRLSPRP